MNIALDVLTLFCDRGTRSTKALRSRATISIPCHTLDGLSLLFLLSWQQLTSCLGSSELPGLLEWILFTMCDNGHGLTHLGLKVTVAKLVDELVQELLKKQHQGVSPANIYAICADYLEAKLRRRRLLRRGKLWIGLISWWIFGWSLHAEFSCKCLLSNVWGNCHACSVMISGSLYYVYSQETKERHKKPNNGLLISDCFSAVRGSCAAVWALERCFSSSMTWYARICQMVGLRSQTWDILKTSKQKKARLTLTACPLTLS